jgi:dTDP-4-amino-4,6-dideoxygalactose transaminase
MCPQGERAGKEVINLPLHARVTEKTVEKTVAFVKEFA